MSKLEDLSLGIPCSQQMPGNLTAKSLLAIAKHCKALETLEIHINCESIVIGADGREFPGPFDSHTQVPSEVISSDYDGCPLRSAVSDHVRYLWKKRVELYSLIHYFDYFLG